MPAGGSTRRRTVSWLILAGLVLPIVGPTAPAWAWGRIGHRVISRLAENQLSPTAKAAVAELLAG